MPRPKVRRIVAAVVLLALAVGIVRTARLMERLFYFPTAGPTVPPRPDVEDVWFTSADGTRLHGWFIRGRGGQEPGPAVLHVHGNAGNIESHLWFSEHLPEAGLHLLIFDYRGYGQSDGKARRRAELTADTVAALDVLAARAEVDPDRLAVFGHSLGGALGLAALAARPTGVRAAVVSSSFASWRDVAADSVGGGPVARLIARLLIPDDQRPEDLISAMKIPILTMHGDADEIIDVAHGRRLAAAGPHVQLEVLRGGGHNTLRETHPDTDQLMIEFLRTHLGTGETAP